MLKRVQIPSPNYSERGGASVRLIVLHTAEGARTIESLGSYFQSASVQASSHVGADDKPGTIGEYVKRPKKAWTQAEFNPVAVSIELCAFASWSRDEWHSHPAMLDNCAQWIREEADHFGIPIVKLSPSQAQGSGRGVCQHSDLGARGGGHTDCGSGFPIDEVIETAKGVSTPATNEEGNMLASALADNGNLHVFEAKDRDVRYTWQRSGESAWNGGTTSTAGWTFFAKAPSAIIGISASLSDVGNLHLFVDCDNGHTYYTWQRKGETSWNGGEPGKSVAGLSLFA